MPSPGDLPNLGIKPVSPALQVDSLPAELHGKPRLKITIFIFFNCSFSLLKALQSLGDWFCGAKY